MALGLRDYGERDVGQAEMVSTSIGTQRMERYVDVGVVQLRECALGLLDGDAAVECVLELLREEVAWCVPVRGVP